MGKIRSLFGSQEAKPSILPDGRDILFENEVLWGLKGLNQPYSYLNEEGQPIDWASEPLEPIEKEPTVPMTEEEIRDKLNELEEKYSILPETKLSRESVSLPPIDDKIEEFSPTPAAEDSSEIHSSLPAQAKEEDEDKPLDLLKLKFFHKDESVRGASKQRDVEQEIEDEAHNQLQSEQEALEEQGSSLTYNLKDFPLAEPELINRLCESHSVFFNLLSKLQETHTPTDFVTAYHIQDRIAYLIDNQTLLYRTLTKKLITYLDRINEKLKAYYDEITLKQEDLRRINSQISRFNEYDRKTQTRLHQAEKETQMYKEDLGTYQKHLDSLTPLTTKEEKENVPISHQDK